MAGETTSIFSKSVIDKLLGWVERNSGENGFGVHISNLRKSVYPEVTGYYIPTLMDSGRMDLALKYAEYLVKEQDETGGYGLPGENFAFDTAW